LQGGVWSGERNSVLPNEFDELLFELAGQGDDRIEVISPNDHYTFITLHGDEEEWGFVERGEAYDECTTLFLIRTGQHTHRIDDLDLCILIDSDRLSIFWAGLGETSAGFRLGFAERTYA